MRFALALFVRSGDWNGRWMKRYALGGLFVAAVVLPAWGELTGGGDGGVVGRGEAQGVEWSLPLQRSLDRGRHVLDATPAPEPARQVDEGVVMEQRTNVGERLERLVDVGTEAPVTFYACNGPNGGFCNDAAGPLPLAEGQAACGGAWPMGAVVSIEGDPLGPAVCNDRGSLAPYQVDRFVWNVEDGWAWLAQVGSYARVRGRR